MDKKLYSLLPKVDLLLEEPEILRLLDEYEREEVVDSIRNVLDDLRDKIQSGIDREEIQKDIINIDKLLEKDLKYKENKNLRRVINGTGTILHTNLGRALISEEIFESIRSKVVGYSNLEYNLNTGSRGSRYDLLEDLICKITGGESALVVNNNAAAVMLVLNTFAKGHEGIVSRGELIEIGGSFRIPDVMEASGCKLVEVGTTNKTHLRDYKNAITEETRVILKVHTSNYKIMGFAESVTSSELLEIKEDLILYEDVGSGILIDLEKYGLEKEPTVQDSIKSGVDLVSFSGDKLLGGVQSGIIVGRKDLIDEIKANPLTRAFRVDKLTLSILYELFNLYRDENLAIEKIPTLRMILEDVDSIKSRGKRVLEDLSDRPNLDLDLVPINSQVGGGSLPLMEIPSIGLRIKAKGMSASKLESFMRQGDTPIIGRIKEDEYFLDIRTIQENELESIVNRLYII